MSEESWLYILQYFAIACPILSLYQGNGNKDATLNKGRHGRIHERNKFRFGAVSDRDKGMRNAFRHVFPHIHLWNCAVHIKRNVIAKYGTSTGDCVVNIAKTFSKTREDELFAQLAVASQGAERYLKEIPPELWRSTAMTDENDLLP